MGAGGEPQIAWLHGWGLTHESLVGLAQLYERGCGNHLFDLPGFGRTNMLAVGADTEDYAAAMAAALKLLGGGPFTLVGHSFGCRIAVRLAAEYPDLVERLVLIAAAGIPRDRSLSEKIRARAIRLLGRLAGLADRLTGSEYRRRWARRYGSADYRNAGLLRETFVKVVNEDLSEMAAGVTQPVLLICGESDREAPPNISEKYEAILPDAKLHLLSGFDHFDILSRGKHQCQRLIDEFLGES
jgi:pimeloyl-ACP methyl ester carboxylesterase